MQVMTHVLPLEFEGSHAVGEEATVTCGMSTEMKKRYITTSTAAELNAETGNPEELIRRDVLADLSSELMLTFP